MEHKDIPYIAFESEMTKAEMREARKDRIIALLAIIILITNMAWLWFFSQFDISDTAVTLDSQDEGTNNYVGNDGDINNGFDESKDENL